VIVPSESSASDLVAAASGLHHRYGDHKALRGIDLEIHAGEIVALLGPNGSGKTTLFRLLSTLLPIQQGTLHVAGIDAAANPLGVRTRIGIVFQSPSLDKQLTVDENIACQAALYGISGSRLHQRRDELLQQLGLTDRRRDRCESLSGGLKRRVELVKGMLHHPPLLLLDEPSTGLDPVSRLSLWDAIGQMAEQGTAVLLTTHLLEEADKADRVAIMDRGRIVAEDAPDRLRAELGHGIVTVVATDLDRAESWMREQCGLDPQRVQNQIRVQSDSAETLVPQVIEALGDQLQSVSVGRPSLEDVFIARTGHEFAEVDR